MWNRISAASNNEGISTMVNAIKRFIGDEKGMETVEWAVLAALIVAGVVGVITTLGTNVLNKFTTLSNSTK